MSTEQLIRDRLTASWVDLLIRIGALVLLLYWSFLLIRPFITIAIWSVMLTVALYPVYDRLVACLHGRRRLAAILLTCLNLVLVIGPAIWLGISLIDSLRLLSERLDPAALVPPPPYSIKNWPVIGVPLHQLWELAATNLQEALVKIAPQLKPVGTTLLQIAADGGMGMLKFFIAIIVAGFLFSPGPAMVDAMKAFSRKLASGQGDSFVTLAGATIRAVSRGVIGISALQAMCAGVGLWVAGVPGASLLTTAILILGIIQVGPSIIIIPLIIWSWTAMEATSALLFTVYMVPVNLMDNVLRPLLFGRGLNTPTLVILIGVIGGTLSHGITGLFLGPVVLTVIWELMAAWLKERELS